MSLDTIDQFHDLVVAASAEALANMLSNPSYAGHTLRWGNYFIKLGDPSLLYEAETQAYIYEKTIGDPSAPGIPRVITCFARNYITYLVSEFIDAPTMGTWLQYTDPSQHAYGYRAVANALDWLRHVSAPPDVLIGQLGGGPARHTLFESTEAPINFASIDAVERYVNKACEFVPSRFKPSSVSFSSEKSVFTQADPDKGNFLMDAGRIVMVDFEDVSLLPESFCSCSMHGYTDPDGFVEMVAQYLPWEKSQNLPTMQAAGCVLQMLAEPSLGLDEHGYPVRKQRRIVNLCETASKASRRNAPVVPLLIPTRQ